MDIVTIIVTCSDTLQQYRLANETTYEELLVEIQRGDTLLNIVTEMKWNWDHAIQMGFIS